MVVTINEDRCLGDCCKLCNLYIKDFFEKKMILINENCTYDMVQVGKLVLYGCPENAIIIND